MCAAVSVYIRFAGSCVPVCGRRSDDRAVWRAALASCSGPARGGSAVVATDGGEPETGYVHTVVSVDVVRAKSDVDGLLDTSSVPMRFAVDAPHIVPIWPVTSSPGMFRYSRSVHTGESYVALVFFNSLSDGPPGRTRHKGPRTQHLPVYPGGQGPWGVRGGSSGWWRNGTRYGYHAPRGFSSTAQRRRP